MSMSPEDLAARIKTKYPDYADVPDRELVSRIISKYPDYQSQLPAFSIQGADNLRGLSPSMAGHYLNLYDEFQKAGVTPFVKKLGGTRTADDENYLYRAGYPTKGNDGYNKISPHQEGRAIDFSFAPDQKARGHAIMAQYARANGLHIPSDEPWHIAVLKNAHEMMSVEPNPETDTFSSGRDLSTVPSEPQAQIPTSTTRQTAPVTQPEGPSITPYDLEWHLGIPVTQAAGWFEGLSKRKQTQVYQTVANAVAQDQVKKAQGIELTRSSDYQASMRKRLGVIQPVQATTAHRIMQVPPEPSPLTLPQVGQVPTMGDVISTAKTTPYTPSVRSQIAKQVEDEYNSLTGAIVQSIPFVGNPVDVITKSRERYFNDEVERRYQSYLRGQQPSVIAGRRLMGQLPVAARAIEAPELRAQAGALKALGGIASLGGITPWALSNYLNQKGELLSDVSTTPLDEQGQAIVQGLPEKTVSAVGDLSVGIMQLVGLKKLTGWPLGRIMAVETALKNSDKPLRERTNEVIHAYAMGRVLDQHLSRPVSALVFGAPTAIQTGTAYVQGNMSGEDALLQTFIQTTTGAILGGKPKGGEPGAITLTKVPDFFPEEVAPGSAKTADWIHRQNEAFTNRIQVAENRGNTAEANRLRIQWSGLQERFGKIMARVVPPEPGIETSPELQKRIQVALENELKRTITRPTEPETGDKQFAGLNNNQLQDLINARPSKGTSKTRRAEIADRKFAAEKELERRLAEPPLVQVEPPATNLRPVESDIPSFKEYVENRPQGGIPFDTLFPGTPEYDMLAREYVNLYGQKGAQQNAEQRTPIQSQRGQTSEGNRQVGSETRGATAESEVDRLRHGQQTKEVQQVVPRIVPMVDGKFRIAIEGSSGTTYRTFNTRAEAESAIARLPRVPSEPVLQAVPPEPSVITPSQEAATKAVTASTSSASGVPEPQPKVLAHVAGPSGAGKTELVNKLGESVKNIDLVDLDVFDEQAVKAIGLEGKPKNDFTDAELDRVHAKRQELIDVYIEKSDKPIVFFGHHIEGENVTDLPTEDRYLLNVSPTKAALNASRRPGKTVAQVKEDIAIGKRDVQELKSLDYQPLSSRAVFSKIKAMSEGLGTPSPSSTEAPKPADILYSGRNLSDGVADLLSRYDNQSESSWMTDNDAVVALEQIAEDSDDPRAQSLLEQIRQYHEDQRSHREEYGMRMDEGDAEGIIEAARKLAQASSTEGKAESKPTAVISHSKPDLDGAKIVGKREGGKKLQVEKKDGTKTVIQNPRGELGNQQASIRTSVPIEPLKPVSIVSGGGEATATTERGTKVNTRYAVVEAKDLVTSHDNFQNENERFPAELQPRDRSRVASAAQIAEIVKNPRPAELADSPKVAHGSPIISDDGVVEVGNGRSIAIRQIYENSGESAERYRQFVSDNADRLGLDKGAIDKATEPVLVRVRTTPLDDAQRVQFVDEGNEQGGARMSAPEQAMADARVVSGPLMSLFRPSESGEINTAANHGFITAFMRDVVGPAIGEYVDARGAVSQAGIARIRNAIFARAYGDSPEGLRALEKIAESPDNHIRNITNALLMRAGGFASLKEGIANGTRYPALDITGDLTKALSKMSALREQGQTVGDYLKQNEMFEAELNPLQRQMLHVLDEFKRSGKAISGILGNYLTNTEIAGDPNQGGLFGAREEPEAAAAFEAAVRETLDDANTRQGQSQTDLFTGQGVPPEPATSSRFSAVTPPAQGAAGPSDQGSAGLFETNQPNQGAGGAESGALGFGRGRVKPPPPLPTTEPELRDVQRQMTPGSGNTHGEVIDGLLSLGLPSAKSPAHLREAETLGSRIGEMNRRAEAASVALGKWITKFYKLGVDRADVEPKDNAGVQFASAMSTGGKIDPELEPAARLIKTLFDGRLRLLEEAGVPLQSVRDNYFPGMWTRESRVAFNAGLQDAIEQGIIREGEDLNASSPEQRQWVRDRVNQYLEQGTGSDRDMLTYLTRRPLAGKESFKKEKVFDDILTAQEFGLRPNSNNPAEIVKVKLSEIDRSIMAHQHFQDLEKSGQIQRITPYEQVPPGWTKINDKYGTIYGPPTIEVSEHIDKAVYQGLLDVANKLGISHERVAALKGGNLGLSFQGENRIQTKFATETSVMAHEIGHQLDQKYDLWNNLLRTQPKSGEPGKGFRPGRSELRDIADLTERGKVARSKEEKIAQVLEAYIHAPERMEEAAPRVYKWFDNFVKTTPELAPLADIKPGIALQKLTTEKYVGLPILGYRIVPEPVGDILNNYLSSSLYNNKYFSKPFTGWMAIASVLNQSQLGVGSAFHASFTSADVQTAAGANLIKDIYGVVRGNRNASDVTNSIGKWTTAIVRTPITGDQVLNAWRNPDGVIDPKIAQVVRAAELAQGGFKIERGLRTEQTNKMVSDWYSEHKIKAAFRSPIAGIELMTKPIMDWLVPRQKAGLFADMAWRIIEQNPGKSLEEMTPDFRKAWNRIDGRLGQVRYDRIFMNNVAKNVAQGLIRAPGWTGGTLVELGGAFKDVGTFAQEWARTGKAPQELPDRVAYGLSLLISTAVVNGALTYAFTGQRPHRMDFFAFRDGNKDKDGNETRLLIPSYMKDILAYYEEGPSVLLSKAHPLISLVNDVVIKNQDYFGTEIRDPHDPYYKQAGEIGKYVLKAFIPFWIRGVQRQQEQGGGYGRMAASYMGVMPAPSYLIQSEATKDLNQMIKEKLPAVRTPPTDRQEAMKEIIQERRSGENTSADLLAARQEGLVNKRDVQRIGEQGRIDPMQAKMESVYRDYGLSGVLDWYERHSDYMDPEMKTDAQKVIRKARISLAQHPENLRGTPAERQALIQRINAALGLKTVPMMPPSSPANSSVPAPQ